MAEKKKKAEYAKPASQIDLEARLENGNKSDRVLSTSDSYEPPKDSNDGRDFRVEGNDVENYVGVSPEYATYANETEAPLKGDDDSAESKVFKDFAERLVTTPAQTSSNSDGSSKESSDEPTSAQTSSRPAAKKTASSNS